MNILQEGSKQQNCRRNCRRKIFSVYRLSKIWKNYYIIQLRQMITCASVQVTLTPTDFEHCGLTEDTIHLFIKCLRIQNVWTHYESILTKLTGETNTPQEHLLTILRIPINTPPN